MCPISSNAHQVVKEYSEKNNISIKLVYVIENRSLSNEIEDSTGIRHESPQFLVFKGNDVLEHTSHRKINVEFLSKVIN